MSETRFQFVELKLSEHDRLHQESGRRHDDSDKRHDQTEARIVATEKLVAVIQKSTATQERMIEVGENVILALGWMAKFAKWVLIMAGFFAGLWEATKTLMIKIGF